MSMNAGSLAHMTYNNYASNGGLAAPGSGFASRGKGANIKRLDVGTPSNNGSIHENQADANATPRTSRAHLLAGLRTAAKLPASAPYDQSQHHVGLGASNYADPSTSRFGHAVPQTATGATFSGLASNHYPIVNGQQHVYSHPEQVLAPPALNMRDPDGGYMDPNHYAHLMAANLYLAQRQQQLQQQLLSVTAAAQQFQGLNLNGVGMVQQQQFPATPITPNMSVYSQQAQNGLQPIVQEVPNQPGLFSVYNPMTGQRTFALHPDLQQQVQQLQMPSPPPSMAPSYNASPAQSGSQPWRPQPSLLSQIRSTPASSSSRSFSPPKSSPSPPAEVEPLPPPSANAFRRGHKKAASSLAFNNVNTASEGPKTGETRLFPKTPVSGSFGPGQGRAGEHPVRQPRGPPQLDELIAAPTTKHEGSKNFATRQRRRALRSLVRAGNERRSMLIGSAGSMTPVSESDVTFSVQSENDSDSATSGSPHGAIGSEKGSF